jgi:hypothetical protein
VSAFPAVNGSVAGRLRFEEVFILQPAPANHPLAVFKSPEVFACVVRSTGEFRPGLFGHLDEFDAGEFEPGIDFYSHFVFDRGLDNFHHSRFGQW